MNDVVVERDPSSEELEAARQYALVIEWSPEDAAFVVSVPDIPEIHTHGATREEAAMAGDHVLALWLSARRRSGHTVPSPSFQARYGGAPSIPPTTPSAFVKSVGASMSRNGISPRCSMSASAPCAPGSRGCTPRTALRYGFWTSPNGNRKSS